MQGDIKFEAFDPRKELFAEYLSRFEMIVKAKSVPDKKKKYRKYFDKSNSQYLQVAQNYCKQRENTNVDNLDMEEIVAHMFDPKRFVMPYLPK